MILSAVARHGATDKSGDRDMNYIRRIQAENAALVAQMKRAQDEITEFRAFVLTSPKFVGVESDGGRKDWIATADVASRLETIGSMLRNEGGIA